MWIRSRFHNFTMTSQLGLKKRSESKGDIKKQGQQPKPTRHYNLGHQARHDKNTGARWFVLCFLTTKFYQILNTGPLTQTALSLFTFF